LEKFFLYIDILGFSNLVKSSPAKIDDLYEVVASLNVIDHPEFKTIIFSDTILVYNVQNPVDKNDNAFIIMYLCEFVKDLQIRLTGRNIYFRAVVTRGEFNHYELNNIPCFYGAALIAAYNLEKGIQCIGLFMTDNCLPYSHIFKTAQFADNLNFVYLTQLMDTLEYTFEGNLPLPKQLITPMDYESYIVPEVLMLKSLYENGMDENLDERSRQKHQVAFGLYKRRYPKCISTLINNNFMFSAISDQIDWSSFLKQYPEDFSWVRSENGGL